MLSIGGAIMRAIAILAAALLAGCVTVQNERYGSGPLPKLSPVVEREIAEYFSKREMDRALAISPDGRFSGRSYCNNFGVSVYRCNNLEDMAIASCNKISNQQCKLYASDNEVVWRDATISAGSKAGPAASKSDWKVTFEIAGQKYFGDVTTTQGAGAQLFMITTPEGLCQGALNASGGQGAWSLSCPNKLTAACRITSFTPQGSRGDGQDSLGRAITFVTVRDR
jgi:hypothetical protein